MKKRIAMLLMILALAGLLCGCGMLIVEDTEPVYISAAQDRTLTELC